MEWQQSVINHLYWAVISTASGEGDVIVDKWKSIERHIQNLHWGHGGKFQRCSYETTREISQEQVDQPRHDGINYQLKRLIKIYFLTGPHYNLLVTLFEGSQAYSTCGALHKKSFDQIILCLSKLYLISLSLGSLAAPKLEQLVNDKTMCKDIAKLSGVHQTFMIEAFHSLVNHFGPKMYSYTITAMVCR